MFIMKFINNENNIFYCRRIPQVALLDLDRDRSPLLLGPQSPTPMGTMIVKNGVACGNTVEGNMGSRVTV
jgi:hypothetical protein